MAGRSMCCRAIVGFLPPSAPCIRVTECSYPLENFPSYFLAYIEILLDHFAIKHFGSFRRIPFAAADEMHLGYLCLLSKEFLHICASVAKSLST